MSFSRIGPPLSKLLESCAQPPDLEGFEAEQMLGAEAARIGFRPFWSNFPTGSCAARRANSMVIDQDLRVFKCHLEMPDNASAELLSDGTFSVLSQDWFARASEIPKCVYECRYGPMCGGGCLFTHQTASRGEANCELKIYTAAIIEHSLRFRLKQSMLPREVENLG